MSDHTPTTIDADHTALARPEDVDRFQIDIDPETVGRILGKMADYEESAEAENTVDAYATDWAHFTAWCEAMQKVTGDARFQPLPAAPGVVAGYISAMASGEGFGQAYKASTIRRRLATIRRKHREASELQGPEADPIVDPTATIEVRRRWRGIRRKEGTRQKGAAAVMLEELRAMLEAVDQGAGTEPQRLRDRALLLIGWCGAFRRSELVGLDVADLDFYASGVACDLGQTKTNQEGEEDEKVIGFGDNPDTCPVRALQAWLKASGATEGPVFRSVDRHGNVRAKRLTGRSVSAIVKRAAEGAGLEGAENYSGHSLRAGFVTQGYACELPEHAIMEVTGHLSNSTTRRYKRKARRHRRNLTKVLGV